LKGVLGRAVIIKLNHGVEYRGILACLDGYLNVAMVRGLCGSRSRFQHAYQGVLSLAHFCLCTTGTDRGVRGWRNEDETWGLLHSWQ
jgi:hypothetical protein